MRALWALMPAAALALFVHPTGPGNAAYIGHMQGFYSADFPMPTDAVSVELWSKLLPVSGLGLPPVAPHHHVPLTPRGGAHGIPHYFWLYVVGRTPCEL